MAMFGKTILRESEDLPVVDHEVTSEEIATQVEDDKLDIIETIHGDDVEEITAEKEIQDAVEAGATQDEVEALQESFIVLKENKAKEFFAKIWEKIQALWAKIKAFFKHMLMYLRSMFMSAKDFFDKYEKDLKKLDSDGKLRDYEYVGFEYKTDKVLEDTKKALDYFKRENNKMITELNSSKKYTGDTDDDYVDNMKHKVHTDILGNKFNKNDDFSDSLYKAIRGGAVNSTDTIKIAFSVNTVGDRIKNGVKKVDEIKNIENKIDGIFKDTKKYIDNLRNDDVSVNEKQKGKDSQEHKDYVDKYRKDVNRLYTGLTSSQSIITTTLSSIKAAYNEEMGVLKRACAGAFSYARKQK